MSYVRFSDEEIITVLVYRIKDKYAIEITNSFEKIDIHFYNNDEPLDELSFDTTKNQYWVYSIDNLNQFNEITCIYKDREFSIIDAEKIKSMYGVDEYGISN